MTLELSEFWEDPEDISGFNGRAYFRIATVTWSRPRRWQADEPVFNVPRGWAGEGGVYAFIRSHWSQHDPAQIAYIGKALNFSRRLTRAHNHFGIIERRGDTLVSCGRVAFSRIRSSPGHYLEIEDIIKFCIHNDLENKQGFESLPGFRKGQPHAMTPWLIINKGHRFGGKMPRRIVYPWIGVEF